MSSKMKQITLDDCLENNYNPGISFNNYTSGYILTCKIRWKCIVFNYGTCDGLSQPIYKNYACGYRIEILPKIFIKPLHLKLNVK